MKYVIEDLRKKQEMETLPVVRMEIDYELMTLYDAMQANDKVETIKSKERLKQLRSRLMKLEYGNDNNPE
ncbi:hypothetical protein SAMN05216238_104304 [Lentibacillus persicus]|uniref:Uncharacterized protein n=1 Tax=Lentibacillus persicus TaxID=640948 RepID=A0A1I1VKF3_9BACI|nr:hypothetical protein [Lentibacillus persicus]SFD83401.1 hypothetical protein SAMN05216238_104304 [Lentibacillus persicus]